MGLEVLRGNNTRCPTFLVGGLLIMCLFLLCNWWSLSSQNLELLKQIDNLAELIRVNGEELGKCSQQKVLLDEKLKDSQNKFVQQQIAIEQVKESEDEVKENYQKVETELQETRKKGESAERNLELCHTEMFKIKLQESLKKLSESKDKTLETLRAEKESLKSDIMQRDKKIEELEEKAKATNKNDDLSPKSKLMQSIVKSFDANSKKNQQKNAVNNSKVVQETANLHYPDHIQEEKFGGEGKNYGDSGLLSVDNDPREEEMRGA